MRGTVETWVNSQWKYLAAPGQFLAEINSHHADNKKPAAECAAGFSEFDL